MQSLRWRAIIALIVLATGLAYMLPSLPGVKESALGKFLPGDSVSLGLDLKGGIYLTLGVDMVTAMDNNLARLGDDLKAASRDQEVFVLRPTVLNESQIEVVLLKSEQKEAFEGIIKDFSQFSVEESNPLDGGKEKYILSISPQYRSDIEKLTMEQAIKTIRNRIDQFGVAEPDIRKQQGNRIQVQLPGLQDPERAIKIIGQTAHLEFKMVDDTADVKKAQQGILAPGRELSVILHKLPNGKYGETPIVLKKDSVLTGEYVTDAKVLLDQWNTPYVSMTFNTRGGAIFTNLTGENVNKRMAIVLDGKVYSAPAIRERISGGRASITGQFTREEARDLAVVLRAGSLPAPVDILEQRSVGPSLGQESIDNGILSALIGMAAVLLFMVVYYGFAGLVADVVLCINIMLIMAGLAAFGATLTLPGIAGIILTIGMAVDANVIIFERIREELRRGLSATQAVSEGYGRATLTILDANVTTIIAAVILYQFGTGPVRGFAVTLTLGIITSMFTAIFVSRILFDLYLKSRADNAKLSI
ncbi:MULTISPECIES: protein translocase subunit SecD [unclassified Pseudodesulfovibrio]|uniref:protein translocase subunit SecD n=1 Tax=unclassified Pseudodesulfovibrio TaxID=2661612 RepID=UPI000FEC0CFF|nr:MULTISPECIES: protein translocase subunit SecD [unclassified Pseudodesulfovibrio]MCJ2163865.1 protein translocase subunit SecD [Pseudodesulfovibrio sp. S3-i]RWU05889.1 protein translocase subunit SecD [Pseudodesulfovibrio sp. S3]